MVQLCRNRRWRMHVSRSMKKLIMVVVCLAAFALGASAQDKHADKAWHTGSVVRSSLASGSSVSLDLGSGDAKVTVVPSATEIVVTPESQVEEDLGKFRTQVHSTGSLTTVKITGPHNHTRYRVEIPSVANLRVHMTAGDLLIKGLASSADITLHAGDLNIELGASPQDFGPVDLSVKVGDLNASMFNADKGGFFRHFHETTTRKYKLKAHVGTGDLTVK